MSTPFSPRDTFLASTALTPLAPTHFTDTNDTCPICRETDPFDTTDNTVVKTPCAHIFHRVCLAEWLTTLGTRTGTCLNCRAVLYQGHAGLHISPDIRFLAARYFTPLEIANRDALHFSGVADYTGLTRDRGPHPFPLPPYMTLSEAASGTHAQEIEDWQSSRAGNVPPDVGLSRARRVADFTMFEAGRRGPRDDVAFLRGRADGNGGVAGRVEITDEADGDGEEMPELEYVGLSSG